MSNNLADPFLCRTKPPHTLTFLKAWNTFWLQYPNYFPSSHIDTINVVLQDHIWSVPHIYLQSAWFNQITTFTAEFRFISSQRPASLSSGPELRRRWMVPKPFLWHLREAGDRLTTVCLYHRNIHHFTMKRMHEYHSVLNSYSPIPESLTSMDLSVVTRLQQTGILSLDFLGFLLFTEFFERLSEPLSIFRFKIYENCLKHKAQKIS